MAAALVLLAKKQSEDDPQVFDLIAGSFRDMTRVAASSPELWRDICLANADSLLEAISAFEGSLDELKNALAARDEEGIMRFFEEARRLRQTYLRITR